jgi:MoaA/NifB/PqqE/SkfB family radical SAM enzyme
MSDKFCIMPFRHQMIEPSGSVKVCCMVDGYVEIDGRPASVQEYPLDTIWRAEQMQKLRGEMLAGGAPAICKRCFDYEAAGGTSYRMQSNSQYSDTDGAPLTAAGFAARELDEDLVDGKPDFYQVIFGNFCNLKCRMCSGTFSSAIENDPVHNAWSPHYDTRLPSWRRDKLCIGPRAALMVKQTGFRELQWRDGAPLAWTAGEAVLQLPWREEATAERLEVEIWDEPGRDSKVVIEVNGAQREFDVPSSGMTCLQFPLADVPQGRELSITIRSHSPLKLSLTELASVEFRFPTSKAGGIEVKAGGHSAGRTEIRGLPIKDIRLHRAPVAARNGRTAFASRFSGDHPWQEQNSLLFAELLAEPTRLRKLQLTGGEPFLMPKTEEMMEYLIDTGVAGNIILNISTNCTALSDALLHKLAQFRHVELCMSIEGVQEDQEYIRFPASWAQVSSNVKRFKTLDNANLQINPTVQIYNMMRMDRLIAWCDETGVSFYPYRLIHPRFLAIEVAPASARIEAAKRVRNLLPDIASERTRHNAEALVEMLVEGLEQPTNADVVADFMRFTNDLDRSRGQNFAHSHGELVEHFAASGVSWLQETPNLSNMRS